MEMKRWMLILVVLLALTLVAPACAPVTGVPEEVVEEAEPQEPTVVEEVPATEPVEATEAPGLEPTGEVISFWTWASTAFEYNALEQMVQQFSMDTGIEVDSMIIR
jgi:ABC-type glycerol-3-phosphate transport system substrate-binding protein